jgi:hypothetical protein
VSDIGVEVEVQRMSLNRKKKKILQAILIFFFVFSFSSVSVLLGDQLPREQKYPVIHENIVDLPAPNDSYSPEEVVHIQLEALQSNGSDNRGIEITYTFSSAAIEEDSIGLKGFERIIKSPFYRPMLNHLAVKYEKMEIRGNRARQKVILIGKGGLKVKYVFYLSKYSHDACSGCWMTDVVTIENWEDNSILI